MRFVLIFLGLINAVAFSQPPAKSTLFKRKNQFIDSSLDKEGWKYFQDQYTNEALIAEGDEEQPFVPSILQSGKDLFSALTGFSFSIRRFRLKGLTTRYSTNSIHEVTMNQLSDGVIPWASWGGLNEVTSNNQFANGLRNNEYQFGAMGSAVFMQLNASKLFPQTTLTINFSNRNYHQRIAFTHVQPINKNGWSFAHSFSYKMGDGGRLVANAFNGFAYFLSVDKRLKNQLWSFVLIGNKQVNTRTAAITDEMVQLSNSTLYQPGWGLQDGKVRNANWQYSHQPIFILSHEYQASSQIKQVSSVLFSSGEKYNTGLDWYNASDPRPDYYRYLPSFYKDSLMSSAIVNQLLTNPLQLQIDWDKMYWVNQHSSIDKRAKYLLEDRVEKSKKLTLNTRYAIQFSPKLHLTFQGQYKLEQYEYFKRVNDLLGAAYSINYNQFAAENLPGSTAIQNDLKTPDKKLLVGDLFGYHYKMRLHQWLGMGQLVYNLPHFDFFAAYEYTYTSYQREGFFQNGVFPYNSYGRSPQDYFKNGQLKLGATYKMNGRNYFYLHYAYSSKPPLVNDLYLSPRINSNKQLFATNEKAIMLEAGYLLNAPTMKVRLNGYLIQIRDAMDVLSFYHDGYRNLVNYGLSNIGTQLLGLEFSSAYSFSSNLTLNAAFNLGRYTYQGRPNYIVVADNELHALESGILYTNQFPVTGTPQLAFFSGLVYRYNSNLFLNISSSIMSNQWISFNPIRRTYDATQNLRPGQDPLLISSPTALPAAFVIDFSVGYSFRLKKFKDGHVYYLQCFFGVNNCLNQAIVTGGYEQLRFDTQGADVNKFPNKYYFSAGALYSLSLKWKL